MCGICGKLVWNDPRGVSEQLVRDMSAVLAHRGPRSGSLPDVKGVYFLGRRSAGRQQHQTDNGSGYNFEHRSRV